MTVLSVFGQEYLALTSLRSGDNERVPPGHEMVILQEPGSFQEGEVNTYRLPGGEAADDLLCVRDRHSRPARECQTNLNQSSARDCFSGSLVS